MSLIHQPRGNFRFLPADAPGPYSSGAIADPGYEIVHAVLKAPLPYRDGFQLIAKHLSDRGRPRQALCAIELRCARPYTQEEWVAPDAFNAEYVRLLREWDLFVDDENPIARTNVMPASHPPDQQVLFAFSYTVPAPDAPTTFVVSGAGERPSVRPGETSAEAIREKLADVLAILTRRLTHLGVSWDLATTVNVYTVHDLRPHLASTVLQETPALTRRGLHWFESRPPLEPIEVELDVRGVRHEIWLG